MGFLNINQEGWTMDLEALIKLGKVSLNGQALDGFFSIESLPGTGSEDGNTHYQRIGDDESRATDLGSDGTPLGTRADPTTFSESQPIDDDCLVNLEEVSERFKEATANRFKAGSGTAAICLQHWKRFTQWSHLEQYTPKQLAAHEKNGAPCQTLGWKLLLRFMREGLPGIRKPASKKVVLASLKVVWTCGLGNPPWPLDSKRDFGRTLRGQSARTTPKDEDIRPFYDAMLGEADPYLKSLMAVDLSCGLRSGNHLGRLTWGAVQYEGGKPVAIVADGAVYNFKTPAMLYAYLPPVAAEALAAWKAEAKDTREETPIWPMRPCNGRVKDYSKPHTTATLDNLLLRWKQRHRIESPLVWMSLRHWVKWVAERAGLSPSTADYLQGHTPRTDGGLSYGKVRDWETVIDEQRSKWPGPLDFAFGPKVDIMDADAVYLRLIADYNAGRIGELELAMAIAKAKPKAQSRILEP
jgi:hypothetical protein